MLLNINTTKPPGIEIGLDLQNMTSMGHCNLNETALLQDLAEAIPVAPVNKQSVFYKRKHKKNFSMHVGNISNNLLNQTAMVSPNDSKSRYGQRKGSSNGFSDIRTNLNHTQIAISGLTSDVLKKDRSDATSPSSNLKMECVTPNLNFC